MKWPCSFLSLLVLAASALAEEPLQPTADSAKPSLISGDLGTAILDGPGPDILTSEGREGRPGGFLAGTHNFDNFIGFMSNPLLNIDPRAVTELMPMTGFTWFSTIPALPSGDIWIPPSAALTVAISERLAVGINQGGYAVAHFNRDAGLFVDRFGRLRDRREFSGQREGWLNLGGFGQYTLIQNVPDQFLLTAGLRWEAPSGAKAVFQGIGPAHLAPYLTAGKEWGNFHVLADFGYDFPAGSGGDSSFFYGSIHFDRRTCCWLYPLVEFNWIYHATHVDVDSPTRHGFIDFGDFESTGNLVTLAVGANAVLIPSKVEFGAVYTTAIATQRDFDFNGLLVKMVLRY